MDSAAGELPGCYLQRHQQWPSRWDGRELPGDGSELAKLQGAIHSPHSHGGGGSGVEVEADLVTKGASPTGGFKMSCKHEEGTAHTSAAVSRTQQPRYTRHTERNKNL